MPFATNGGTGAETTDDTVDVDAAAARSSSPKLLFSMRHHLGTEARLILASESPRRREILGMMGLQDRFETIPSPLDESALQLELSSTPHEGHRCVADPKEYTRILAEEKARALAISLSANTIDHSVHLPMLILGSDTIVELDGKILEKPVDQVDANKMLCALSGREHYVHTGVAIFKVLPQTSQSDIFMALQSSFTDTAYVQFAELSQEDIDAYIATGEPMDKAGSYGIQGIGGQLVKGVRGDFFTVSGLHMR